MRTLLPPALAALLGILTLAAPAAGQYPLRGVVRSSDGAWPVSDADVSLLRDTLPGAPVIRSTRSGADGRFALDAPVPGAYAVRVRYIGLGMRVVPVSLPTADSLTVALSFQAARGAYYAARARYRDSALAAARSRPRHWTCEQRRDLTDEYAHAWLHLVESARINRRLARDGIPTDTAAFLRAFRPIADRPDCVRLARRLDASEGLVDDRLVVFRIGRMYLLPELGSEGVLADRDGRIVLHFVTPD